MTINFENRWIYKDNREFTNLFKLYRKISPYFFQTYRRTLINKEFKKIFLKFEGRYVLNIGAKIFPYDLKFSKYETLDIVDTYKPTYCEDIHITKIKSNKFNTIIGIEVLEHLNNPYIAVKQIKRILKKEGTFIGSTPFIYPYHGEPQDILRFTEYGLKEIFKDFEEVTIIPHGNRLAVVLELIFIQNKFIGLFRIFFKPLIYLRFKHTKCPLGFIIIAKKLESRV